MKNTLKRMWMFEIMGLALGLTFLGHLTRVPAGATKPPLADTPMLDIIVQSPIAVVQYKNGDVDLLLPKIEDHPYGFVKGLSDCELEGPNVDSQISFSSNESSTDIDPDKVIPAEVLIDSAAEAVNIDPHDARFTAVRLPRPGQILPIHLDDEGLAVYKPNGPIPSNHRYPTALALRYKVQKDVSVSITNPNGGKCNLETSMLGNEILVYVGMGPVVEDQPGHAHAKAAFHSARDLLPPLNREIHYKGAFLRASDCKAPILLVVGSDRGPRKSGIKR